MTTPTPTTAINLDNPLQVLKSVFDCAGLGLVVCNQQGRIKEVNSTLEQMFEFPDGHLQEQSLELLWHGPSEKDKYRTFLSHIKQQQGWQGEVLSKTYKGRIFPVSMRWLVLDTPESYCIGIIQDLTERRRWQSQLLEEKERAERYLDISQAMILSLGTDGCILEINRRGCEILGYPEQTIIGQNWFTFAIPEPSRREQLALHERLLAEQLKHPQEREGTVITATGVIRNIIWNHSLIRNELNEITGTLSSGQDNSIRKQAEQEILRLAMTDHLTGLVNRRSFYIKCNEAITIADRSEIYISVITFDLDHFKPINDRYGHDVGDKVLIRVAEILRATFRDSDTVGRLGGDEFAVIAIGPHHFEEIRPPLERLLKALGEPMQIGDFEVNVGASIGIALFPDHGKEPDELMRKADIALYEAKRKGRNRIQLYNVGDEGTQEPVDP
ncbi:MAG: sensor domain-containing diguanylate cyclase [Motiliproteus sp.]